MNLTVYSSRGETQGKILVLETVIKSSEQSIVWTFKHREGEDYLT